MIMQFQVVFLGEDLAMSKGVEDLQMLRLIRAFQKLTDEGVRRMVVLYVEEQLQKQQAKTTELPPDSA